MKVQQINPSAVQSNREVDLRGHARTFQLKSCWPQPSAIAFFSVRSERCLLPSKWSWLLQGLAHHSFSSLPAALYASGAPDILLSQEGTQPGA